MRFLIALAALATAIAPAVLAMPFHTAIGSSMAPRDAVPRMDIGEERFAPVANPDILQHLNYRRANRRLTPQQRPEKEEALAHAQSQKQHQESNLSHADSQLAKLRANRPQTQETQQMIQAIQAQRSHIDSMILVLDNLIARLTSELRA
ncbi:hypothetical protein K474DRAFT_1707702 [Panus rudis PR-1116 ss-1]|nr:hypothetical protein K474DRAFT_1707702 [Panus rudis PR-1116 ss-1]